jgi:hypothetical protein
VKYRIIRRGDQPRFVVEVEGYPAAPHLAQAGEDDHRIRAHGRRVGSDWEVIGATPDGRRMVFARGLSPRTATEEWLRRAGYIAGA